MILLEKIVKELGLIILGCTILAIGVESFYNPNNLVAGGITGLGIVIDNITKKYLGFGIPLWFTNLACNVPLFVVAWHVLGKKFLGKTLATTLFFSFALFYASYLPDYRGDMILVCVYGGIFVGIGAGFVLRAMATTGGTELAVSILHKKMPHISVSKALFIMDASVILLGLATFGPEKAMYAVASVFVASRCVDTILVGLNFSKAAFIISDKSEEIASAIMQQAQRGVTSFCGKGMYTKKDKNILLCVFSQKEIAKVKTIIMNIDNNAFLLFTDAREVLGEGFQKLENR